MCPGEECIPLQGLSFWESSPPMGPPESPTGHRENQEGRRKRLARRPRRRRCLLKGCEQRFHPRQARQRYCSERCREAARKWSRWKAEDPFRRTSGILFLKYSRQFLEMEQPDGRGYWFAVENDSAADAYPRVRTGSPIRISAQS